jgi:peptide/nickel transport system substrate-binding protein
VRQAILLSIDRKAINDRLFEGKQPVANSDISPLDPMYSQTARHYGYDPAAAKKLLDEAGFATIKNGFRTNAAGERFSIEITTTAGNRIREQVAQVIQSQLRQVGIELRLKAEPPRIFSEALNRRNFTGLAMYAWVSRPQGVPRSTLHSEEIPTAKNAWSGQNYPGLTPSPDGQGARCGERELDKDKRSALFADIQKLYAEDLPVLPMFFRVDPFVIPKALKGVRRPAISTARRSGSSSGAGKTEVALERVTLDGRFVSARAPGGEASRSGAAGGADARSSPI